MTKPSVWLRRQCSEKEVWTRCDNDMTVKLESMDDLADRIAGLPPAKRALLELRLKKKGPHASGQQIIPHRVKSDSAPLSFAQQRLWFLNQMEPDSPAYNQPKAIRLSGVLNVEALQRSLSAIEARHTLIGGEYGGCHRSAPGWQGGG